MGLVVVRQVAPFDSSDREIEGPVHRNALRRSLTRLVAARAVVCDRRDVMTRTAVVESAHGHGAVGRLHRVAGETLDPAMVRVAERRVLGREHPGEFLRRVIGLQLGVHDAGERG
jgi:hypothetical protein